MGFPLNVEGKGGVPHLTKAAGVEATAELTSLREADIELFQGAVRKPQVDRLSVVVEV